MKHKKQRTAVLLAVLAVVILLGTIAVAVGQQRRGQVYEELPPVSEPQEEPQKPDPVPEPVEESVVQPEEPEPYQSPVDFQTLQERNPHIYGWIEIEGTDVSYPLVQHPTDRSYYLDHTIEGKQGLPGSVYTETGTAMDGSDRITVIYGHNMKNGSMFGGLKRYRDEAYLKEHNIIHIYTPEAEYRYQIFAAVVYDDRYIPSAFDTRSKQGLQDYLNSIYRNRDMNSVILTEPAVTAEDHVLTLSTCIGGRPDNRYLVEAVMIHEEP